MLGAIIAWIILGAIAGYIARFLMPGPDPMGCVATTILGVVGSFVGGFLASLLFDGEIELSASGIIGSIVGALIVLFIVRRTRRV